MKLRLHAFDLPLKHTFTISRGSIDIQQTLVVELADEAMGRPLRTTITDSPWKT